MKLDLASPDVRIERLKTLILFSSLAVLSAALLCGCGKGSSGGDSADQKAFDSASPELKELWAQSQAAAGTNDFVAAVMPLRSMLTRNLSEQQMQAVQTALGNLDAKLMRAASRGDPAAQKALEMLRSPDAQVGR